MQSIFIIEAFFLTGMAVCLVVLNFVTYVPKDKILRNQAIINRFNNKK